jgi:hypothetical protein
MTAGPLVVETAGEGWYIDGTYLSDLGTLIEPRDGWDDTPPTRGDNSVLLGYDGVAWREKLYDAGRKTITIGIHGAVWDGLTWLVPAVGSDQRALYEANLDALLRVIGVRHRPLVVERIYPDGSRRRASCEVTGPITPATTGNTYGQVQFELIVIDAFWEDAEELSSRLPYVVGGAAQQRLEVYSLRGQTAPCQDAEVTVTGPCSSVTVVDELTGRGFTYADALDADDVLVVQPDGRFAATVDDVSVITDVEFDGPGLLKISPAPAPLVGPAVLVTTSGATSGFTVTLRTRGKYLR